MRSLFCFSLFILLSLSAFAQIPTDKELRVFMKQRGYVSVNDISYLHKDQLPYYSLIVERIKDWSNKDSLYVRKESVIDSTKYFALTIYPLNAIKDIMVKERKQQERDPDHKYSSIPALKDFSYNEMVFEVYKATNKIAIFEMNSPGYK
jgi:hypothetical protein